MPTVIRTSLRYKEGKESSKYLHCPTANYEGPGFCVLRVRAPMRPDLLRFYTPDKVEQACRLQGCVAFAAKGAGPCQRKAITQPGALAARRRAGANEWNVSSPAFVGVTSAGWREGNYRSLLTWFRRIDGRALSNAAGEICILFRSAGRFGRRDLERERVAPGRRTRPTSLEELRPGRV